MDRRFFLALVLTMGVIVVIPRMFPADPLPIPAAATADTTGQAIAPGATPAATPTIGAPTVGGLAAAAPTQPAAPVETRTIALANELATFSFSTRGAALERAELPLYRRLRGDTGVAELVDRERPLIRYRLIAGGDTVRLDEANFTAVEDRLDGRPRVTFTTPVGAGSASIAYTITSDNYMADVAIRADGVPAPAFLLVDLPGTLETQERDSTDDRRHLAYAMRSTVSGASRVDFSKPDPGERLLRPGPFSWTVAKSKYFLVGLLAKDTVASPLAELQVTGAIRTNKIARRAEATVVAPIGPQGIQLELYAGPQEWRRLIAQGRAFEHTNPYGGWFSGVVQPFATIVMRLLLWLKDTTALSYGWILVIFGVAVRVLTWPLNTRMMRYQIMMQRVGPAVQAVQAKHKGDPERLRTEITKVYAEHGISMLAPLYGCLPALIPMPVLLALFFVFQNTIEFRGVPFLWFPDISVADPLYIAPFLAGGSMFILSWLSMRNVPPNPQTKMMSWMMPVVMTVFGLNFASGLNLYWFVQNFAAMPQQWLISNERAKASATPVAAKPAAAVGGGEKRKS